MKLISSNIKLSKALFVAMLVFVSIISLYKFHILYADILTIVFIAKTFIHITLNYRFTSFLCLTTSKNNNIS